MICRDWRGLRSRPPPRPKSLLSTTTRSRSVAGKSFMTAPTEDNIVEQLVFRIIPNGRLLRTWQLNGGISARMTAFEVALPDGLTKKMILRRPGAATLARNPRAAADEFTLLRI